MLGEARESGLLNELPGGDARRGARVADLLPASASHACGRKAVRCALPMYAFLHPYADASSLAWCAQSAGLSTYLYKSYGGDEIVCRITADEDLILSLAAAAEFPVQPVWLLCHYAHLIAAGYRDHIGKSP